MTPENIRYHAAGHIAAAALLVQAGDYKGAQIIMHTIEAYIQHPKVQSPPAVRELVSDIIEDTPGSKKLIETLEEWFVASFNTKLEISQNG